MRRLTLRPGLRALVDNYAQSHRHPVNEALHFLGIPVLAAGALGLLALLNLPLYEAPRALQPNAAWPVLLVALALYLRRDWRFGLGAGVGLLGCYVAGCALSLPWLLGLLGAGVVAHAVGHYGFEGRPPAVFKNPLAVLEAPVWLASTWAGAYP